MPVKGQCAKQLGHSIEMFQRTYSKWLDGEQDDREMDKLEVSLRRSEKQRARN
jgi:integrase